MSVMDRVLSWTRGKPTSTCLTHGNQYPFEVCFESHSADMDHFGRLCQWVVNDEEYVEVFDEQVMGYRNPPFDYQMGRSSWEWSDTPLDDPTPTDRPDRGEDE